MGCFSIALSKVGTNRNEGAKVVGSERASGRRQSYQIKPPNTYDIGREEGTEQDPRSSEEA